MTRTSTITADFDSAGIVAEISPVPPQPRLATADATTPVILHTRVVTGSGGGPDKTILNSAAYADPHNARMAAAYIHPRGDTGIETLRARAQRVGFRLHEIPESGPADPRTIRALYRLCKRLGVTIWHAHDYKSNAIGLVLRRYWPMHLITTVHGWTGDTWRTRLYERIDRSCLRRYDQVIAVSPALAGACRDAKVDETRLSYIPNGIDCEDYRRLNDTQTACTRLGIAPDQNVIGVIGRLSVEKGVDRAIRCFARLSTKYPDTELHLVGDGPERDRLHALAAELGVATRTRFWGWQTDTKPYLEAMRLLLLPSHTEGLPNAVLEAMSMGVAVAAAPVGGMHDLLDNGRCGTILSNSEHAWPTEIAPLLTSAARCDAHARLARARIESRFSFDHRMAKVFNIYGRLLPGLADGERPATLRAA